MKTYKIHFDILKNNSNSVTNNNNCDLSVR